jgi:hypothetical protein
MPEQYDPQLAHQVLGLRRAGIGFDTIADRFQLTPEEAKALFDTALSTYDLDVSIALEADRLDRLHTAIWPAAVNGDVAAVDRVLKISERRDRVVSTPRKNQHQLRQAFDESARTSEQLHEAWDSGLLEAGRKIADRVDEAVATGEGQEVTKALYLVPHMVNILREMLATPASRAAVKEDTPAPQVETKLSQLRAIHKRTG